jgi:hypothetical protein
VQEQEATVVLEGEQDLVNKELQQDLVWEMDTYMVSSDEQDPVVEELMQALVLGVEQSRATMLEGESPMLAFQALSSLACPSFPQSNL